MHNLNQLSPLSLTGKPFKPPKRFLKYRRNKSKVYARLERLKDLLGLTDHGRPVGITEGAGGGIKHFFLCFIYFPQMLQEEAEVVNGRDDHLIKPRFPTATFERFCVF